jgi:outer membrane protein
MTAVLIAAFAVKAVAAADQTVKFGYVDFQKALNDVEEGKKAKAMLKSEFDEKQKKLDQVQNELQAMKTDLDKQRLILSADALKAKQEEFTKKYMDLQQKVAAYKEEIAGKEMKLTGDILAVVHRLVRDIGEKEGYTMILEKSQDIVIYSPKDADLTERIIKEYNGMPKDRKSAILKEMATSVPRVK